MQICFVIAHKQLMYYLNKLKVYRIYTGFSRNSFSAITCSGVGFRHFSKGLISMA